MRGQGRRIYRPGGRVLEGDVGTRIRRERRRQYGEKDKQVRRRLWEMAGLCLGEATGGGPAGFDREPGATRRAGGRAASARSAAEDQRVDDRSALVGGQAPHAVEGTKGHQARNALTASGADPHLRGLGRGLVGVDMRGVWDVATTRRPWMSRISTVVGPNWRRSAERVARASRTCWTDRWRSSRNSSTHSIKGRAKRRRGTSSVGKTLKVRSRA